MAETSPPCSLGCAGRKVCAQQTLAGWPSVKCEVKTGYWWRDGKTLRVRTWIPNVALPPKSSVRAIFTQRAPSLRRDPRRWTGTVSPRGRRGFSSLLQYPAPKSGPHPSRSSITSGPPHPRRARGPEPVPDPSSLAGRGDR